MLRQQCCLTNNQEPAIIKWAWPGITNPDFLCFSENGEPGWKRYATTASSSSTTVQQQSTTTNANQQIPTRINQQLPTNELDQELPITNWQKPPTTIISTYWREDFYVNRQEISQSKYQHWWPLRYEPNFLYNRICVVNLYEQNIYDHQEMCRQQHWWPTGSSMRDFKNRVLAFSPISHQYLLYHSFFCQMPKYISSFLLIEIPPTASSYGEKDHFTKTIFVSTSTTKVLHLSFYLSLYLSLYLSYKEMLKLLLRVKMKAEMSN